MYTTWIVWGRLTPKGAVVKIAESESYAAAAEFIKQKRGDYYNLHVKQNTVW